MIDPAQQAIAGATIDAMVRHKMYRNSKPWPKTLTVSGKPIPVGKMTGSQRDTLQQWTQDPRYVATTGGVIDNMNSTVEQTLMRLSDACGSDQAKTKCQSVASSAPAAIQAALRQAISESSVPGRGKPAESAVLAETKAAVARLDLAATCARAAQTG